MFQLSNMSGPSHNEAYEMDSESTSHTDSPDAKDTKDEDDKENNGCREKEESEPPGEGLADVLSPWTGIATSMFGVINFSADIGSDLWLAIEYFITGDVKWGAWTLSFFLLPPVVLLLFAGIALLGLFLVPVCDLLFAPYIG